MRGEVRGPELGPEIGHGGHPHVVPLHDGKKGGPVVAPVRVVGVDPGYGLDLALPVTGGEDGGHDRLALVVAGAERVLRLGHRLLDALLGGGVPGQPERLELLGHRTQCEPDTSRDTARDHVDLVLQGELTEALHGVLGTRLFLDHELDLAPEDASPRIDPVDPPLGPAQTGLADLGGHARFDDQNAQLDGPSLGEGGGGAELGRGRPAAQDLDEGSPGRVHCRCLLALRCLHVRRRSTNRRVAHVVVMAGSAHPKPPGILVGS